MIIESRAREEEEEVDERQEYISMCDFTLIMVLPQADTVGEPLTLKGLKRQNERSASWQPQDIPTRLRHAQC
jgi:hypothetical protein